MTTTTLISDLLLPALRELGVLADVVEISAGIIQITLTLAQGDDAGTPAPPTLGTMSPGEAAALWHLSGGIRAV